MGSPALPLISRSGRNRAVGQQSGVQGCGEDFRDCGARTRRSLALFQMLARGLCGAGGTPGNRPGPLFGASLVGRSENAKRAIRRGDGEITPPRVRSGFPKTAEEGQSRSKSKSMMVRARADLPCAELFDQSD